MFAPHFATHRIAWSRALIVGLLVFTLFKAPPADDAGWIAELSEMLGFALLVSATLWRIWCHLFIAGTKNGELASTGPYSVVRNPLYLGNLLGIIGFGFAVEQPMLALFLGLVFALFYPSVVAREERDLARIFGERYAAYCAAVPRWMPAWSQYREPAAISVAPRKRRGAILDAMWFLWAFALWEFVEELHKLQLVPTLF